MLADLLPCGHIDLSCLNDKVYTVVGVIDKFEVVKEKVDAHT